jgi:hypothetical protein
MSQMSTGRFRRGRPASVEELQDQIKVLVAQRQALRDQGARPDLLERNRRRLARCQWALSLALVERYRPHHEAA